MVIQVKELSAETFAPYGQVLTAYTGAPLADDEVITYWGGVGNAMFDGPVSAGMLFGHPRRMATNKLERHRKTPEVLVALEGDAAVCVGEPGEPDRLSAFLIRQGESVALKKGAWHWTPFPTDEQDCRFLVLFHSGTENRDLEIRDLQEEIFLSFDVTRVK